MSNSTKFPNPSGNKITYYIVSGWAIVVAGILLFYGYNRDNKNEFWSFNTPNKRNAYVVLDDTQKLTAYDLGKFYEMLSQIQNLEKSTIIHGTEISLEEIASNNTIFFGSWNALRAYNKIVPDSIISFDQSQRILNWKHQDGFYDLSLNEDPQSLTYALAVKIQTENTHQSILFIHFDEIDQAEFLHYLLEPSTIETLKTRLKIRDKSSSFIALFKMPKKNAPIGKIELLDGFTLNQ